MIIKPPKDRTPENKLDSRLGLKNPNNIELPNTTISKYAIPTPTDFQETLIKRSLRHFMRASWSQVEPGTNFLPGWHIDAISDHLEAVFSGQIKRLIINIPPRHCKSLNVSVFWPAWIWANRPETRFIFGSHDQRLSTRDNLKMRRLVEADWYKSRFPHVVLEKDQNAKNYYENTATGHRLATSVGAGVTGEGGDILVCDDPHNAKDAITSAAYRLEGITWWSSTMSTRLNPGSPIGAKLIIMQRLHERDLTGHLLAEMEAIHDKLKEYQSQSEDLSNLYAQFDINDIMYDHLCLPAHFDPAHPFISKTRLNFKDPRTTKNQALWETAFDNRKLAGLAIELGAYQASGQLEQRPSPEGGGIIKSGWFIQLEAHEWPTQFDEEIMAWDMAWDEDPEADFTVGVALGRIKAQFYINAVLRRKLEFTEQLHLMKAANILFPNAHKKIIEKAASGVALVTTLQKEIPGLVLMPAIDNKMKRAHAWSPYAEAGNIFVPKGAPWLEAFLREMDMFPNGANDDQVDAVGLGITHLAHNARVIPTVVDSQPDRDSPWSDSTKTPHFYNDDFNYED